MSMQTLTLIMMGLCVFSGIGAIWVIMCGGYVTGIICLVTVSLCFYVNYTIYWLEKGNI